MRAPLAVIALFVWLALAPAAALATPTQDAALRRTLAGAIRNAGAYSGAYVVDDTTHRPLFSSKPDTARIL
ncbi:MAG: hypothetical protein QOE08_2239, partial [Thermoleophilaceae bacterium]|nr:hypothetical protein [Thermoleophilaceae bacterium]